MVRDYSSKVIMLASVAESIVASPEAIEALAVLKSLQICTHLGIPNLIIESDCLLLVEELNSSDTEFCPR